MSWISSLPKVLSHQVNRLRYENQNAVKVLTPFILEQTIYPDRFMIQNRSEIEKIRSYVQELRERIHLLEAKLKEYSNFQESDCNLHKALDLVSSFFRDQGKVSDGETKVFPDLKLYSPLNQPDFSNAENP